MGRPEDFEDEEFDDIPEDLEDDFNDDDFDGEFSPEDEAEIKRAEQDCNMGFSYEMVYLDGKSALKCNKCGRIAELGDRPFPHRYGCPMKR